MTETRSCLVCGEPVPTERQQYCSRVCMKRANRWATRTRSAKRRYAEKLMPFGSLPGEKRRICLKCGRLFKSSGLRICPRCTTINESERTPRAEPVRIDAGGRTRD